MGDASAVTRHLSGPKTAGGQLSLLCRGALARGIQCLSFEGFSEFTLGLGGLLVLLLLVVVLDTAKIGISISIQ
eukprot:443321-Rhodomonas_salina.1